MSGQLSFRPCRLSPVRQHASRFNLPYRLAWCLDTGIEIPMVVSGFKYLDTLSPLFSVVLI